MSILPALADDLSPGAEVVPFGKSSDAFQLLVSLEETGAITATAMRLPDIDWDLYESVGAFLGGWSRRLQWLTGDWLLHGRENFGERFAQAATITGLHEQVLLNRMFVCENIPEKRRVEGVSFSAHALVARLEPKQQTRWLTLAKKGNLSATELRERMKASRRDSRPALPGVGEGEVDSEMLLEVGEAILRDAHPHSDDIHFLVPREDIVRLRAALGKE